MNRNSPLRRAVIILLGVALLLPIALCVIAAVSVLLHAMGDPTGGAVLGRIALGLGILWAIGLIVLLILGAVQALGDTDRPE